MAGAEPTRGGPSKVEERGAGRRKLLIALAFAVMILLNLVTFVAAFPQIAGVESGYAVGTAAARDFSAFYVGAWRLLNDPSKVYAWGYLPDGELHVFPVQEQYKYLPSFLLIVSPLLLLSYQQAIIAFDLIQFLLLPLVAFLVYCLTREKGTTAVLLVGAIALLLPFPAPGWSLSVPYFWQWKEGQSKVVETLFLLLSLYFGRRGRSLPSGAFLGLSFFDPRFALVALPLFYAWNREKLRSAVVALLLTLLVTNLPLLWPGTGAGFVEMVFTTGLTSILYPYALIPLLTVVALTVLYRKDVVLAVSHLGLRVSREGTLSPISS